MNNITGQGPGASLGSSTYRKYSVPSSGEKSLNVGFMVSRTNSYPLFDLCFLNIDAFDFPLRDPQRHRHWPAAYFTINDKLRAALTHIECERKRFAAMRAFD